MKSYAWMLAGAAALMLLVGATQAADPDLAVDIQVSPATLVMDSPGTWVTIHTDIPYGAVQRGTVRLNGLVPTIVMADLRGDLVAKFPLDDVLAIVAPPSATLTLTGLTTMGEAFAGSETVRVVDPPRN